MRKVIGVVCACSIWAGSLWAQVAAPADLPDPPGFPSAELAVAEESWKVSDAARRARLQGAAGQVDLFWEVLKLLEKDPKAREAAPLLRILDWLVFDMRLQHDRTLVEPLYARLPQVAPTVGAKLLDSRLQAWMQSGASLGSGQEPWRWPEIRKVSPEVMREAAQRLFERSPKHNPSLRFQVAATLVAFEAKEGQERFAETRAELQKELPELARQLIGQATLSLLAGGVKPALRMVMAQAQEELKAGGKDQGIQSQESIRRLHLALGWKLPPAGEKTEEFLAKLGAWLDKHEASLEFDAQSQRFRSNAPAPGYEDLFKHVQALDQRFEWKLSEHFSRPEGTLSSLGAELTKAMAAKLESAQDPDAEALAIGIVQHPSFREYVAGGAILDFCLALEKVRPELAAKVWAHSIRNQMKLAPGTNLEQLLQRGAALREETREFALVDLRESYRKLAEEAGHAGNRDSQADHMLNFLLIGGTSSLDDVEALIKDLSGHASEDKVRRFHGWCDRLVREGRVAGLAMMLHRAQQSMKTRRDLAAHPMATFAHQTGWITTASRNLPQGELEKAHATYRDWLARNYNRLRWDPSVRRFRGAEPTADSPMLHFADALCERYGIQEQLTSSEMASVKSFHKALLERSGTNHALAQDADLALLTVKLGEEALSLRNYLLQQHVYSDWPKLNRAAGVELWSQLMLEGMETAITESSALSTSAAFRMLSLGPVVDGELLWEARKRAEPAFRSKYKDQVAAQPAMRSRMTLACMAFGGPTSPEELGEFVRQYRPEYLAFHSQIGSWTAFCLKQGLPSGLALSLLEVRLQPHQMPVALSRFDRLTGIQARHDLGIPLNKHEPKVHARLRWLEANLPYLTWNVEKGQFVLDEKAGGKPFVEEGQQVEAAPEKPPAPHPNADF